VLDMGEPVRIVDLARDLSSCRGGSNKVAVVFIRFAARRKALRGALATEEATKPTPHPKLRIAQARRRTSLRSGKWSRGASDRASDDAEVRAEVVDSGYAPPAGAGRPLPITGREEAKPLPLRPRATRK
jgi:FlaA1/EpsC-like NDP-sugar epimerase